LALGELLMEGSFRWRNSKMSRQAAGASGSFCSCHIALLKAITGAAAASIFPGGSGSDLVTTV
jgi:hypothetical protein